MHRSMSFRRRLAGAAALSLSHVLLAGPAFAQSGGTPEISVPAAPLGEALKVFSEQTGVAVVFTEAVVQGKMSAGTGGAVDVRTALTGLLQGTGLEAVPGGSGYVIRARAVTPGNNLPPGRTAPVRTPADAGLSKAGPSEAEQRLGQVTVTGTSLRGIAPESSPLQIYSREDILGSGVTTTEQFIRTLPQNFGGGSSELAPTGYPNDINSRNNNSFGTGANLRGLGSRGTLVLLNGNRMAPSSSAGDFVDVSLIPVSAIERVDVLTDGASSIYGGDAVAGVMNFVLRDDFDGAETSLRYGGVTDGDLTEVRLGQTVGKTWTSGNLLGTYEFFERGNLTLADRPGIGVPQLTNGDPIPDPAAFDLLPEQRRHSGVLSGRQAIGPNTDLVASALFSRRDATGSSVLASGAGLVQIFRTSSDGVTLNAGIDHQVSPDWSVIASLGYSDISNTEEREVDVTNPSGSVLQDAQSNSDLWSADARVSGTLFQLPGGPVLVAAGTHFRRETFVNETQASGITRQADRDVTAVFGEVQLPVIGEANALPLVQRLELNLSARADDYSDYGSSVSPKAGLLWSPHDALKLRASYSESFAPPSLGRVGALDRNATVFPLEFILGRLGFDLPDPSLAGTNYMLVGGTSPDLSAEESRAFTTGFDFEHDRDGHSWTLGGSYYDVKFEGRLGATPVPGNVNPNLAPGIAWNDASAFPEGTILFFPGAEEIAGIIDTLTFPARLNNGATLENIGVINRINVVRNLSSVNTRGLDFQAEYARDASFGRLAAGVSGSYILEFRERAAATTPEVSILNTVYNPIDLKLRGSLAFSRDGFSAAAHVNYLDRYKTDTTPASEPVPSWTTVDAVVSWTPRWQSAYLQDLSFSVSAQNLLDEPPPATPPRGASQISGYDPANASPLGRFLALEIRKSF